MQDYFKYDKIQGGAPLRMKSDSDGVTDGQDSNVPLGIKTTAQGIKHFTNWDDISNSLDAQNKARFDDTQPNALRFSMNNARGVFKHVSNLGGGSYDYGGVYPQLRHAGDQSNNNPYYQRRQSRIEFEDRWDAEDITILDDMAFVSYPDYTDIHRANIDLRGDLSNPYNVSPLKQLSLFGGGGQEVISTLRFNANIGALQQVFAALDPESPDFDSPAKFRSLDFTSLDNTILKIRFTKGADGRLSYNEGVNQFSDQPSGNTSDATTPEVVYFVYGGVLSEQGGASVSNLETDFPYGTPYLDESNILFDRNLITTSSNKAPLQDINGNTISGENNNQIVGKFYLVPWVEQYDGSHIPDRNTMAIQLDITTRWAEDALSTEGTTAEERYANWLARRELYSGSADGTYAYTIDTEEITLIKIQPVRKCGKVDIYTRKKGIIDAVVGNTVTSPGHTLNTNDVIEISSAIFDGSQAGYADIHPMNGKKFVRKIDDDTFDIFDDQFFQDQTDTSFLKSTMGINWICISSNYGAIGQSWDYYGTIFSPTGRNGYLSASPPITAAASVDSLADSSVFFTTKRIDSIFATKPTDIAQSPEGSRTTGVVNIDFRNSYNNPLFAKMIDDSIPERFSQESPLSNVQYGPQDFYPYYCSSLAGQPVAGLQSDQIKSRESTEAFGYTTTPYNGCRFGSSLDIKFSHIDGDSRVYTLAVGERGSDISVDLFGVEESECHIDTYGVDNIAGDVEVFKYGRARHCTSTDTIDGPILKENFRRRIMPWYLPYGKTHILTITIDRYGKVSDISHKNSLFGGGSDIINDSSNNVLISHREANPWKNFEKSQRQFYPIQDVDIGDLGEGPSPFAVFDEYVPEEVITLNGIDADAWSDDDFIIMGNINPPIRTATDENVYDNLTDGVDDPFLAILAGRTGVSEHDLSDFQVKRSAADVKSSTIKKLTLSVRLSRDSTFDEAIDDTDANRFKFTFLRSDGVPMTDVFMPNVLPDAVANTHDVQAFTNEMTLNTVGRNLSPDAFNGSRLKIDVDVSDHPAASSELGMTPTYKIHSLSVHLQIQDLLYIVYFPHDLPIPPRIYSWSNVGDFDEEDQQELQEIPYWLDINNRHTSKYWLRAAALHWYPQEIYGYNYNMIPSEPLVTGDTSQIPRIRSFNTHSYTARLPAVSTGTNTLAGVTKTLPVVRRDVVFTQAGNADVSMSRFGYSGFTSTPSTPEFFDINRFSRVSESVSSGEQAGPTADSNLIHKDSQWYIFPWVDSFGKSVALQHTTDGICVLSGCRSRANEEVNAGYQNPDFTGNDPFPLQPSNLSSPRYSFPQAKEADTKSRIGHINIALLNSSLFYVSEFNELNAGGTIFTRNFQGGNTLESRATTTDSSPHVPVKYLQLPTGTDAGFGMPEVINSAELSNSRIVWKDDYILFSEQNLYNLKSLLYVFKYNNTTGFVKDDEISVPFVDSTRGALAASNWPRNVCPAYNVGDGFGLYFRYDKDLLVTNGMQNVDQLGDDITIKMFANNLNLPTQQLANPSRIDALSVYERRTQSGNRKLKFVQTIYPSIDSNDQEQYPRSLITGLQCAPFQSSDGNSVAMTTFNYKYLVPLHTLTYDNVVSNSLVWNINWNDRYDVVGTKIIIKDPLEYSLYSSTFADKFIDLSLETTPTSVNLSPYLTFTEHVETKTDSLSSFAKYTYDSTSVFTSSDDCGGGWVSGRDKSITKTPVMFFNVPLQNLDVLDSVTIKFNVSNQNALTQRWLKNGYLGSESISATSLVPRIVLYKKDPRSTIILNGPSDSGLRDTYFPHYANGIFKTISRPTASEIVNANQGDSYFDTSSTQMGLYNDQHQAFFRGGAADLFFYGALPASIVNSAQQNITNAIAAGYPNISLPFYYGGGKNLGEYFDLSYGSHGSTGMPVWISNDTLDSPFLQDNKLGFSVRDNTNLPLIFSDDNLKLIEPYAKLFTPTIEGDLVSLTISAADLRDFIIDGSLVKGSSDDRSVFGNRPTGTEYPEIYNDSLGSPGYDDINKASYTALDNIYKTIAIGFVMTNVSSHSVGSDSIVESVASEYGDMAFRTINRGQADALNPVIGEKRYPYAAVANLYEGNIKTTSAVLDFNFTADVSNVMVNADIRSIQSTRYSNQFHKIAIFDYHQEASDDIKSSTKYNPNSNGVNPDGSIGFGNTQFIEPFARSKFSPLTIGLSNSAQDLSRSRFGEYNFNYVGNANNDPEFNAQYRGVLQSTNSIVRFSNTSVAPFASGVMTSSTTIQDSLGSYSKSIQILNSENLNYNDSSYYVNPDNNTPTFTLPPTGHILGDALFRRSSLLGGFDIYDPEFVPLFVRANERDANYTNLFAIGMDTKNNNASLKTRGIDGFTDDMPLKIGIAFQPTDSPLFTHAPHVNSLSLFTIETPPSAIRPLYTTGPDISGGMNLVIDVPITGGRPLYVQGPTQLQVIHPSQSGLFTRGRTDYNLNTDLFMAAFDVSDSSPSLYIEHGAPYESQIPLTFSPGFSGVTPLYTKVPDPANNDIPNYLKGPEPSNLDAALYVDPYGGVSGLPTLMTKGPSSFNVDTVLFTGPRASAFSIPTLYIDTPLPVDNDIHLFTQSFKYTSNSNSDGDGKLILTYRDGVLLDGDNTEQTVTKTISNLDNISNVQEINSNSITYPTLFDIDGSNSSIRFTTDVRNGLNIQRDLFMGTHDKWLHPTATSLVPTYDPPFNTDRAKNSISRLYGWYGDLAPRIQDISDYRSVIRDNMFDSNGKYVVVASQGHTFRNAPTGGIVAIYKINHDGSLNFDTRLNTVYFDLKKAAAGSAILGNVGGVDIVDGFYSIRQDLYDFITSSVSNPPSNTVDYTSGTKVRILDIAISKQNKCAISLRCYFAGSSLPNRPTDVIVEFDILDYISSIQGFATNQVTACVHNTDRSDQSALFYSYYGTSLSYCGETLYYNGAVLNASITNNEYIYAKINDTTSSVVQFHPDTIPDAQLYLDNSVHLNNYDRFTAFGYVVKCFDRYETNDKIIFVSAPLFDPYLNNTLTSAYRVNPMGAVYIFIQSLGSTDWTYQGAVYAKGFTSANIVSNLSQYKNGQLNAEYALFGYDLDYTENILLVSEPGGNSAGTTNSTSAGRCYRFDLIDPTNPVLLNTYKAADFRKDPLDVTSDAVGINDNFGSSVVLFNKKDAITWSDSNIQKEIISANFGPTTIFKNDSTLYNLNSMRYHGFQDDAGDNYDSNLLNEVKEYFSFQLRNLDPDDIRISSRILVMKKLKFGDSIKLGVLREFRVTNLISTFNNSNFKIHKLSIIEPDKIDGLTLFIKGPTEAKYNTSLVSKSIDTANTQPTLMTPGPIVSLEMAPPDVSLFLSQKETNKHTLLYLRSGSEVFSPLYQIGGFVTVSKNISLVLPTIGIINDMSLHAAGITNDILTTDLIVGGTIGASDVINAPLFIGQEAHKNKFVDLFINNQYSFPISTPGAVGVFNQASIRISGGLSYSATTRGISPPLLVAGPDSASGVLTSPLYITTDIPPTGESGLSAYNLGMNLALPVSETAGSIIQDNTLFIKQRATKTETTNLYIERNQPVATTVFMSGLGVGTGIMPLSIEATYANNENTTLITKPLPAVGINLTSRGFVE